MHHYAGNNPQAVLVPPDVLVWAAVGVGVALLALGAGLVWALVKVRRVAARLNEIDRPAW